MFSRCNLRQSQDEVIELWRERVTADYYSVSALSRKIPFISCVTVDDIFPLIVGKESEAEYSTKIRIALRIRRVFPLVNSFARPRSSTKYLTTNHESSLGAAIVRGTSLAKMRLS